jgi:uncharacterized protein (DUF1800 family)
MRLKHSITLAASALLLICLSAFEKAAAAGLAVTVGVSPATATVAFGGTRQFTATVAGSADTSVTWSVDDIPGGNSMVGTISASGNYTAPSALPAANPVTIKATSVADPMMSATASVTVRYPTPGIQWWSPGKIPIGQTTFTVYGTRIYNGAVVTLDDVAVPTTYVSSTELKAVSNASQSGSAYMRIVNPGPPGATSSARVIEFGQGIIVTIAPNPVTVAAGAKQQFTATVTGAADTVVWWYVNGGNANGKISSNGLYTAPAAAPAAPVTIRAVSSANSERQGTATITVTGPQQTVAVGISPASANVQTGMTRQFTATVTGTANTAVTWQVNNVPGGDASNGTISNTGLYTAPASVPAGGVTVGAISQADNTKSATAAVTVTTAPVVTIGVSPASASVQTNATRQFTATVTGSANTAVTWQVNNVTGGDATNGTISNTGLYTAPAAVPAGGVTVGAISQADNTKSATAAVTVTAPPVVVTIGISPVAASLVVSATQQFTATVTGSPNTDVTWQVNNVTGGSAATGTISLAGLYTAPNATPPGSITVTAVSQADATKKANAGITIANPQAIAVGRFLEQASFGPTPQLMGYVQQVGIQAWLDEQFNTPESLFPNGNATTANQMMDQYYGHFLTGQDQLRQRVIHTLTEVIAIARSKNNYPNLIIPWLQILSKHAFGNYKNLLKEMTLDASMGNFLDMVNSTKPGIAGGANENYARELMQLFTIGLYELNPDGSQKLDANGKPIPTYNQTDVRQLSLALTGWTFNRTGSPPVYPNPNYYPGPMVPLPNYHDTTSKTFLGHTVPANQTIEKDLDDVIEIIFNHPNVGPFIAARLTRGLVTSNPSPAYIQRITDVFNNNGQGVRGDMKEVVRAILLDPEARNDTPPNDFGKLRSPLLHHISLFRVLGGTLATPSLITYAYDNMGESILNPPSVFGHYSPMYRIPKQSPPLFGPEFQIHGPGELVNRGNLLWSYMSYYQTGIWDLQWLFSLGNDHSACINAVDNVLLYGRMSPGLRQALQTALQSSAAAGADAKTRALTALYLTAMSSEYLVMH